MIALRVLHNGKEICVAGIGEQGGLHAGVSYMRFAPPREAPEVMPIHIEAVLMPSEEVREWNAPDLAVGDTVTFEVVETEEITPPDSSEICPDEDDEDD